MDKEGYFKDMAETSVENLETLSKPQQEFIKDSPWLHWEEADIPSKHTHTHTHTQAFYSFTPHAAIVRRSALFGVLSSCLQLECAENADQH